MHILQYISTYGTIISFILTIALTIVQAFQSIKSGQVAVCRYDESTTKLFTIMVSFIFIVVVLNVHVCTLIKGIYDDKTIEL